MPPLHQASINTADDVQLLNAYVDEHSQAAFAEFVRRHIDFVYATALRRVGGDSHLAEDVAQAVFTDLARKAPSLRERTVLTGWLYRSTRFAAAQTVRTERRRRTHEQEAYTLNELNAAGAISWDRIRPVLDEAMEDLSDLDREAVLLRYFENRPLAEVGSKLAVSADAARMRVDRALDKLRGLLAKRGVVSTTAALATAFATQASIAAPAGLGAKIVTGVFSATGAAVGIGTGIAKTSLALGKLVAGCVIGALGLGIVIYEVKSRTSHVVSAPGEKLATNEPLSPPSTLLGSGQLSPGNIPAIPVQPGEPKIATGTNESLAVTEAVARLDRLVGLTPEQKTAAVKIFADEEAALQAFASAEERLDKGTPVRQNARAKIRTLLTPNQQKIYDEAPQRLGGASMQDAALRASRIDSIANLTNAQAVQVAAIFQNETDALQALSPADRAGSPGASIRQSTKAQVRALLTPEQRQKYDANPGGNPDSSVRIYVDAFVKNSPAIAGRVGPITQVRPGTRSVSVTTANEQLSAMKGSYRYEVQGNAGSETFIVTWEKSASGQIKILKIEGNGGEVISP